MRTYEDILQELNEYKEMKLQEINKIFKQNDIIETLDKKFGYQYGIIKFIFFDDETGQYYLSVNPNKHNQIKWTNSSHKTQIKGDDLNLVKVIENPILPYLDELDELLDYLNYGIDEEPLTTNQREKKVYDTKQKIKEIQHKCVHDWQEVEEGGWLNKKRIGYKCSICGLFDDDPEE